MAHQFTGTHFTAVLREQEAYYGRSQQVPPAPGPDQLGEQEEAFIQRCDSFYLASVNQDGWPYIQHRGGPRGFLKMIDALTLGFADLSGNRQLLTAGNVTANDCVALFLMDYARRERLKISGHATIIPVTADPALAALLVPAGIPVRHVERLFRTQVTGYDWNSPKYITPRFTAEEIGRAAVPLKQRIAEFEAALAAARPPSSAS